MNVTVSSINRKDTSVLALPGTTNRNQQKVLIPLQALPYKRSKVLNFRVSKLAMKGYELPEYNLYEISQAEDGDGIIRKVIQKKAALMFKEGWKLNSLNPRTIQYIKDRFDQLAIAQRKPINILLQEIGADIVRYHNAFLCKIRDDKNSGGKTRTVKSYRGNKKLKPVSAYFRLPAETMRVKTDKFGNAISWMQEMPDGRYQEYDFEDIIHFYYNRRAGFTFAAPGLLPAIDDVRSLRQIEEYVELLVEQYLFPLFTLTIGTDTWPADVYDNGETEVDVWTKKINAIDINGGLVMSHRHKLEIKGFEKVIPVEDYLKYFKQRLYTACGVSPIDMGETDTSNRSTADSATKQLIDDVKDYQRTFKALIEFEIINELLLENFTANVLSEGNIVTFDFNEIDIESMMKLENHHALMYSMNYKTETEARTAGKHPAITSDEQRQNMFLHQVDIPKMEAQGKINMAINSAKPTSSSSTSKSTNVSKNRQQPTNQHKTLSGPSKRKSSLHSEEESALKVILSDFTNSSPDLNKYRALNWYFSLDHTNTHPHISLEIFETLDKIIASSDDLIDEGYSDREIQDILFNQLIKLTEE